MSNLIFPTFWQGRPALGLLVLRLVFGAAFVLHGAGKITHAFDWMGPGAPVPGFMQALAALSEFGGGLAMILGFLTPLAALGLLATMSVALLTVHIPAGHSFVSSDPSKQGFELPMIYWTIALTTLLTGPGAYSVDALLFNRKKSDLTGKQPQTVS